MSALQPGFLARSKKAIAGGITAAITAAGTAAGAALVDGEVTSADWVLIGGAAAASFLVGFAGVWVTPANATDDHLEAIAADLAASTATTTEPQEGE